MPFAGNKFEAGSPAMHCSPARCWRAQCLRYRAARKTPSRPPERSFLLAQVDRRGRSAAPAGHCRKAGSRQQRCPKGNAGGAAAGAQPKQMGQPPQGAQPKQMVQPPQGGQPAASRAAAARRPTAAGCTAQAVGRPPQPQGGQAAARDCAAAGAQRHAGRTAAAGRSTAQGAQPQAVRPASSARPAQASGRHRNPPSSGRPQQPQASRSAAAAAVHAARRGAARAAAANRTSAATGSAGSADRRSPHRLPVSRYNPLRRQRPSTPAARPERALRGAATSTSCASSGASAPRAAAGL